MISTAIRAATSLHRGCGAMVDGYDRTEAAKHYSRRSAAIEAAAASLRRRVSGLGEGSAVVVNWYTRTRRSRAKDIGRSSESESPVETETEKGLEAVADEAAAKTPPQEASKICLECGTSVTPMWRPGPQGPKSLCNACGIKYRRAKKKSGAAAGGGAGKIITVPVSATFPEGQVASMSSPLRVVNTEDLNKASRDRNPRRVLLVWEGQKQRRKKRPPRRPAASAASLSQCSQEEADAALLLMSLSSSAFLVRS